MQYLISKDNFTKITEPKGTLQNISRTLTIEVSNTQTENSGVLLPPMCKIQFDGDSVYVRCVDGAGAEARVIPFEVVVKGGDGGGTDFSLDQAGTTIVEDFKFSALEYPNATNPNLDGKTVLVMSVKDANATTSLVKYVFVDLAKLIGASTNLKPSDNAIGISGASIGLNLSASAGNILSVTDDGLYGWLGVAGGVSGNFAILGESGAIVDGGFSFADFVTPDFTGATSGISGLSGLVPAPAAGDESKFLRGDGSWATVQNGGSSSVVSGGSVAILDTVPSTVDGGLWYDTSGNFPVLKIHHGNYDYSFNYDRLSFVGDSSNAPVAYLPFNSSVLVDAFGNTWTTTGNPEIQNDKLYLDGSSYLTLADGITLGGKDFTVDCWATAGSGNAHRGFWGFGTAAYNRVATILSPSDEPYLLSINEAIASTGAELTLGVEHHIATVYQHGLGKLFCYVDGVQQVELSTTIPRAAYSYFCIGAVKASESPFVGTMSKFRIFDDVAIWTQDFTPPTESDY